MKDGLGDRMKTYENASRMYLDTNLPILIRLDGKAFHTFTRNFRKPFSIELVNAIDTAAVETAKSIGYVRFGYTQSDEISFILNGWENPESEQFFGGNVQKISSVIASMMSVHFNEYFSSHSEFKYRNVPLAFFDCRCWNVPNETEIVNYFIWRQNDCIRNSISMLAQSIFSHKELHGKSQADMLEMCANSYGNDWEYLNARFKFGAYIKKENDPEFENRTRWSSNSVSYRWAGSFDETKALILG